MEMLSKVHAHNLVSWAADKPRVVVLSADLTSSCEADLFRDTYPDRFFSLGIAEQNMVSWAGGLAREGFFPFIHTFAVFMYRRAYDQIAMSVAYPNLPVRFFGFLPGITTPGGASHQAIEDIASMRALPNMTILETGDATEVESVLDVAQAVSGPVYIRMMRGEVPRLFPKEEPMQFNRVRVLSRGDDITLITSGILTEEALRVVSVLSNRGMGITHLHASTIKPFSDPVVQATIATARLGVITMENHTVIGGLGTIVAELMAQHGIGKRLIKLGLQDTFAHGASKPYLMHEFGLDAFALVKAVETLAQKSLHVTESELAAVRIEAVHSLAKPEGL